MGKETAVGKNIRYDGDTSGTTATVVGVINDYVYGNMYTKSDPVLFVCTAPQNTTVMYVRTKAQANTAQALAKIETVMKSDNPAYPFNYTFVDDQFNNMFLNEMLISKLSRVFATLAILISCLGLFGLAAYTAERRTKEIGVRKVLGASVAGVAGLLSKDFLKLVTYVLSCCISGSLVDDAKLVKDLFVQDRNKLVDIFNCRPCCHCNCFGNRKFPGNKGSDSKPGEEFENGIDNSFTRL